MPKNLFIDTNVFLSFYHLTSDDHEELKKLSVLIDKNQVRLFLPEQVVDEFNRNRQSKIADSMKRLSGQNLSLTFPQICKDFEEYLELRTLQKQYEEIHAKLVKKLNERIALKELKADTTISELFTRARKISTLAVIEAARTRAMLGNPPGKAGSLGDAINWEALLYKVPESKPLHFVTDDNDYTSPINRKELDDFLYEEWKKRKAGEIIFYRRLSEFFKAQYPDIKLASEIERDLDISKFADSSSFAETHAAVAKLSKYTEFSASEANAIVSAAVSNSQISWIASDPDVKQFLQSVVAENEEALDEENLKKLLGVLGDLPSEDDEFPF